MTQVNSLSKKQLREHMQAKITALSPEDYSVFNSAIQQRFLTLPVVRSANRIMFYYAIKNEVATAPLISELLETGKTIALPTCVAGRNLRAGIIHNLNELVPGIFGIMEPATSREIDPGELELIVVPGVAFDKRGIRLGHGAGYYDRFLTHTHAYKLGLAYDFQIMDNIKAEPHDIAVHALLTPSQFFECETG